LLPVKSTIPNSIHPIKSYAQHSQLDILSFAVGDQALLHAILAYTMFHKIAFHSGDDSIPTQDISHNPTVLFHKTKAMHFINKELESGIASDKMIATTLILQLQFVSYAFTSAN
jgi:Fungal specific transcription factor domain